MLLLKQLQSNFKFTRNVLVMGELRRVLLFGESDEKLLHSYVLSIYGIPFMSDSLNSVWVHSVYFAKFRILTFSKG